MSLLTDIKSLKQHEIALLVATFLATIAPGFIIIFLFAPNLLKDLDVLKLTILSFSITLPVNILNTLISFATETEKPIFLYPSFAQGAVVSAFVFYIPIAVTLFSPLSVGHFVVIAGGAEGLVVIAMIRDFLTKRKKT